MTTFTDVIDFITDQASTADMDAIIVALNARQKALQARRAASIRVGMACRLDNISPKYLSGLTGTVHSVTRGRAVVTLDEESTATLRNWPTRFYIAPGQATHDLMGVPLSSIFPI